MSKSYKKDTILKLLSGMSSEKEIRKYLDRFSSDDYKFAVITMEHDVYTGLSNSVKTRYESRKILEGRGYYCVFKDILDTPSVCANSPYEDWWVHPDLVDMDYIRYVQDKNQGKTSTLGVETKIMVDSFKSYEVEY